MIPLNPKTLLISQIIAHMSIIPLIVLGEWWHWVICLCVYFLTGCLGMTVTYHRLIAHRSWNCPDKLHKIFVLIATIGLTGSAISWVSIHRSHHRWVDSSRDPHSPMHHGYLWTHFMSMFAQVNMKMVPDMFRNPFYVWQHKHYFTINIVYAIILCLIDPMSLLYAWLVPAAILWNAGSSIVSISHRGGHPHNDFPLAVLVWGEGNHKNHHDAPNNYRFGKIDLGGFIIEAIQYCFKPKHG